MLYSEYGIASIASSVAEIMDVPAPEGAQAACPILTGKAEAAFGGKADRVLIYNPDAVGLWLYEKYTSLLGDAVSHSSLQLPLHSVMPSVTPVCFASMYSGLMPEAHGIRAYEKPVLTCDTLFDALIRAGKKPAIISTTGDSISVIFLGREMDYFIYDTEEECNEKALELIEKDEHDLIVVYNGNYDAAMHRDGPEGEKPLRTLKENARVFAQLHEAVCRNWKGHDTLVGFCPDHGCHEIDGGMGSHGLDMESDMNVIHMFDFMKRRNS